MKRTLWITGVAGFTGRHLVEFLKGLPDGPRVVGLDLVERPGLQADACHRVDLARTDELVAVARSDPPSWVIHLAAAMPPAAEPDMWHINVGCTVSLLNALATAGCRDVRLLGIGSAAEYLPQAAGALTEKSAGGGASLYGRIKWAQTLLTIGMGRELGLPTVVARPFNLIGPGLSANFVAGWLCEQSARPEGLEEITIGNLDSARDFVDVRDAVRAYWLLVNKAPAGGVFNVCTGAATSVRQILSILCELSGRSPRIRVDPQRLRQTDPPVSYGDYGQLERATGWQPRISVRESLAAMLEERVRRPCAPESGGRGSEHP